MARHSRSGNSGHRIQKIASVVADLGNVVPRFAQTIDTVGSIVGFRRWARTVGASTFFRTREQLWMGAILPKIQRSEDVFIAEFGVAFGEASEWWLANLKNPKLSYHGFDLFTGLPSEWRNLPSGAFDAGGRVPQLDDSRVVWHVGDVSETVNDVDWESISGTKFINFDLDLFAPSLKVWKRISSSLKSGDILYFDEAFDSDERVLINSIVLQESSMKVIGASPFGVALEMV